MLEKYLLERRLLEVRAADELQKSARPRNIERAILSGVFVEGGKQLERLRALVGSHELHDARHEAERIQEGRQ